MTDTTTKHIYENPDSIEVSTPAKGGMIKVYHTSTDPEGFKAKIKAMFDVRDFAASELAKRGTP